MRELDWLILRKLYEKRSISKAAEDLYVTQSALTKRVKAIEQEWGIEVVKRSNQGVTFTEDGRYLVKKAGIMLDFSARYVNIFQNAMESRNWCASVSRTPLQDSICRNF